LKKESKHSFLEESTIWQWLKAFGQKMNRLPERSSSRPPTQLSRNVASNPYLNEEKHQKSKN